MNPAATVLIGISITTLLFGFRKNADIFHPARFWIILWSMVIGVTLLNLSYYQREWSLKAWFVIVSGLTAYPVGVLADTYIHRNFRYESIPFQAERFNDDIKRNSFRRVIYLMFLAYTVAYILEWQIIGYLPLFTIFRETQRHEFGIFGLHLIVSTLPIVLMLISEYLLIFNHKVLTKVSYGVMFLVGLISYVFLLNRLFIFMLGFMIIMLIHYLKKPLRVKALLITIIVLSFVFWGVGELRTTQFIGDFIYNVSNMKYSEDYANFTGPYMYTVMNLENVANGVKYLTDYNYGANILDWIYALLQLQDPISEYLNVAKFQYIVTKSFTTMSYMWYFYADFGIAGVVIGSLIWGIIMSRLYHKMRSKPNLMLINLYALLTFMVFLSFFTFMPAMLNSVFQVIALTLASGFIENPTLFKHK